MDFGVLDGLISSQNNNNNKNTLFSCCDLDSKPKWYGPGGVFSKHENPVSVSVSATREDEWRDMKMAKLNDAHNMLSFSSPNTNTVTLPYYARNTPGYGNGGPFTQSQWMELEHQALIYKYITANAAIPTNLLIPIKKVLETAAFSAYSGANLKQNTLGWGSFHLGFCNSSDPEPGRCRRTDGKKWRCAKDAVADQKYCERHMNRGRHRSRKPVEGQTGQSVTTRPAGTGAKLPAVTAASGGLNHGSLQHSASSPALSSQENRSVLNKANLKEPLARTEFGLVCSDSLLNPLHKSDHKSQTSLRQFMEDWPNSDQAQLSITTRTGPTFSSGFVSSTSPPTTERLNLSPLRMGLGMGNVTNEQHASQIPISWETSMGGPLGEVLQHSTNNSPSALNLMTDGWDNSPQMTLSPTGVLQKTTFGHLL